MKNEKGQTTVEYILLIAVIVGIMLSVFQQLEEYLVTGPNSLQNKFIGSFQKNISGRNSSFEGKYKYFRVRR